MRMMQKVKEVLHQKDVMKTQMEEAFSAKEAVSTYLISSCLDVLRSL